MKLVAPDAPDQLTVKPVPVTLLLVRLVGAVGKVYNVVLAESTEPVDAIAVTITAYDVPTVKPVNVACLLDTPLSEEGVVSVPLILYV